MNRQAIDQSPLVSVVIPTYNSDKFVAQAVESALAQTYTSFEIIVIDDGSTDETREVLGKFNDQIHYVFQPNSGPSAARNAGIRMAKGAYICFLDADDLWTPDRLAVQIAFMEENPNIGLLFSDHEEFDEEGIVLQSFLGEKSFHSELVSQTPIREIFAKLLEENFISTPTVMARKQCFERAGLFDEAVRSVEDLDLWLRIAAYFPIACLPQIVCRRRIHKFNISRNREVSNPGKVRVYETNRRRFPDLAPREVWHRQIANAYLEHGYTLLAQDHRMEALRAGLKSLRHAVSRAVLSGSLASYPWMLGIGLILAPFVGWRTGRALWRAGINCLGFRSTR